MKVLFVSNDPAIFDAASAVRARMRAYAALIGELHIVSVAGADAREEQEGNLYLHPVRSWKLFRVHALTARAHALILTHRIEVVSAQDPFEQGLAALKAIRGTGAKLHIQAHTDVLSPWFVKSVPNLRMLFLNRYRRRIADRVLPVAHGIRVVSERVKVSLIARYGSRIPEPSVIPVPVDATVPPSVPLPKHSFTFALITVGRLEPEKRVEDILAALKLVVAHYPMAGLFVVGDGRERGRLERMVRSLGLAQNVIFLGQRSDAWSLMRSAHTFIQASAYEGYSRTLVEAALASVPIITTDVGIVGEVFTEGQDVLSAPVVDPAALSRAIIRCIEDNALRQALSQCAEAAARAHLALVGDIPARIAADLAQTLHRGPSLHV